MQLKLHVSYSLNAARQFKIHLACFAAYDTVTVINALNYTI